LFVAVDVVQVPGAVRLMPAETALRKLRPLGIGKVALVCSVLRTVFPWACNFCSYCLAEEIHAHQRQLPPCQVNSTTGVSALRGSGGHRPQTSSRIQRSLGGRTLPFPGKQ
jgi:hypothetical protein